MLEEKNSIHGEWSSRFIFILAATGSAVGLGNIWKFPYMTGANGGGAFVIVYLFCILLIGLPIMITEIMLGRRGRHSPINSIRLLAQESGRSPLWRIIGWSGVIAGFLILSFYSVVAGWALAYIPRLAMGMFNQIPPAEMRQFAEAVFNRLTGDPERLIAWHTLFMGMVTIVIAQGIQGGLEKAIRFMMPVLFILLLILVGYAMNTSQFMAGIHFLFDVDFNALFYPGCTETQTTCQFSRQGILAAMGHAFFTLSLGMGAIMTYGAYLSKEISIVRSALIIVAADTVVAILAGIIIFPIVFSNGLEPNQGPGLVFMTLPIAFGQMPGGSLFGTLFFILLSIAAWTSAISIIEPTVAWLVESGKFSRSMAAIGCGSAVWLVGFLTILSFNLWQEVKPLSMFSQFADKTWFDLIDYLTANIMLPLGGLAMAIFAAWFMQTKFVAEELHTSTSNRGYQLWLFLLRYITPLGIGLVFLNAIGVLDIIL